MGRLAFRIATQLFGGRADSVNEFERQEQQRAESRAELREEPQPLRPAEEAARILERALAQVETLLGRMEADAAHPTPSKGEPMVMPQELTELNRALREVVRRLEDALDHLGMEAQRLSDEASRLALVADRLEARATSSARPPVTETPPLEVEPEPVAPAEPRFAPGAGAVDVVVAAVPGFQGLMDVQRGLSGLPAVEGASVHSYRNGEAALGIVLRSPVSARDVVEGLRQATGHELIIEESRSEDMRLRLRFTNHMNPGRSADRLG